MKLFLFYQKYIGNFQIGLRINNLQIVNVSSSKNIGFNFFLNYNSISCWEKQMFFGSTLYISVILSMTRQCLRNLWPYLIEIIYICIYTDGGTNDSHNMFATLIIFNKLCTTK